ncbi:hypothetical protein DTL42_03135 [Bremerella cremea]|uniref:Uncharacterized protein n=1 Tax=Bremerella cremea TaxID=1031537 RepID=A0A368KUU5_9BACT|nr:hypothetical protein DTL42_03135 [Bremerella cremea]
MDAWPAKLTRDTNENAGSRSKVIASQRCVQYSRVYGGKINKTRFKIGVCEGTRTAKFKTVTVCHDGTSRYCWIISED